MQNVVAFFIPCAGGDAGSPPTLTPRKTPSTRVIMPNLVVLRQTIREYTYEDSPGKSGVTLFKATYSRSPEPTHIDITASDPK